MIRKESKEEQKGSALPRVPAATAEVCIKMRGRVARQDTLTRGGLHAVTGCTRATLASEYLRPENIGNRSTDIAQFNIHRAP